MDGIEEKVYKDFANKKIAEGPKDVTEVTNKGVDLQDKVAVTREKLRGNFQVQINKKMPHAKQVMTYAGEDLSYYLHKRRNFFERLDGQADKDTTEL